MSKRLNSIGIKQDIRLDMMQLALDMQLAGLDPKNIRTNLFNYVALASEVSRSIKTTTFLVSNIMNTWNTPAKEIIPFRDSLIELYKCNKVMVLPVHWAMISAAYPFWFNVALQTGRLLSLQEQVTQKQIVSRLKEYYGDRQTVSRYAIYVIRSFVNWGVLLDSGISGCYVKNDGLILSDLKLVSIMFEAILYAMPSGNYTMNNFNYCPALFPFSFQYLNGIVAVNNNNRLRVSRFGLDDEILTLACDN